MYCETVSRCFGQVGLHFIHQKQLPGADARLSTAGPRGLGGLGRAGGRHSDEHRPRSTSRCSSPYLRCLWSAQWSAHCGRPFLRRVEMCGPFKCVWHHQVSSHPSPLVTINTPTFHHSFHRPMPTVCFPTVPTVSTSCLHPDVAGGGSGGGFFSEKPIDENVRDAERATEGCNGRCGKRWIQPRRWTSELSLCLGPPCRIT